MQTVTSWWLMGCGVQGYGIRFPVWPLSLNPLNPFNVTRLFGSGPGTFFLYWCMGFSIWHVFH